MNAMFEQSQGAVPLVSVVIPSYNHARYIVDAVESVLDQTLEDWELVIIDDGSTDDTLERLRNHARISSDPRIRLHSQENGGSHAAINAGLSIASGCYLAVLNSDDRFAPARLETLVRQARLIGDECFVVTGLQLIDEHGARIPETHWWNRMYADMVRRWRAAENGEDKAALSALMWGNLTVSTSNFFISRTLWQRLGPLRHLRYVLDWEYALRVAAACPKAFCFLADELLLEYRLHGANTILGGALRNHAEAYHVLRGYQRRIGSLGLALPPDAIDRLHYLGRFIRHEHARQQLERQQAGWLEQVDAVRGELAAARGELEAVRAGLDAVHASRSWRLTAPLRRLTRLVQRARGASRQLRSLFLHRISAGAAGTRSAYDLWLDREADQLADIRASLGRRLQDLPAHPVVSVLMPVHDTPPEFLRASIESVRAQWYPHWELCICDDASTRADTRAVLEELERDGPRIRMVRRERSGHIACASNDALSLASGEFVLFLDHDDLLAPQAALRAVEHFAADPDLDFVYSDEDKLDARGRRCLPLFKPDWSESLEWSQNYVGHIMCARRSLIAELGGFVEGSEGSQDHDLVLRAARSGARIGHIPEVLYHWRMHAGSTASTANSKPYAHEAGRAAVARHLAERYPKEFDRVDDAAHTFVYTPRFRLQPACKASIIIPTRDKVELLQPCIDSIRDLSRGLDYEIIVLDNGSSEPATHAYFDAAQDDPRIRVVPATMPFNWSRLNNLGRRHARGELLVFLNNDTLVISPDWLQRLAEYAMLPDVGMVGPLLQYPDGTIQHAGVVVGMGGWADHVFKGTPFVHYPSPFVSAAVPRNVLALTGACQAISTNRFDQLGGFDEAFEICGSDVEICIRAHEQGLQNIYLPTVRLYHLESKTRSTHVPEGDFRESAAKYAPYREQGDPYYNPNLDPMHVQPRPRFPSSGKI